MTRNLHNWDLQPLSNLVDAIRQQSRIEKETLYELWSIPSFTDGKPELIKGKSIGSSKLRVEPNDILLSKINPRINRVWIVEDSHLEQLASPEWLVARIKDPNQLDKQFLCYYLSSPEFRDWISQAASSVTGSHSRAKANEILQRNIPLPPLPEQQKIVELLEDHLSRLDAALADVKQATLKAAQFRRSLLQAAFTGNLSGDGTRLVTEWKTEKLSNLLTVSIGGIWGEEAGIAEIDVSVVRVTELKAHGRIDPSSAVTRSVTLKQLASRELQEGDLLLEKSGGGPNSPVGRVGYFFQEGTRTVCSNFMQLMRPDSTKVFPKYLFYFLDGFHSTGGTIPMQTATTNIRNIKTPQYMDIDVPVPPIPEQQKIVELLEDHLSRLDASVAIADAMEKQSASLRRSLLQAAFTGQLTKEVASV